MEPGVFERCISVIFGELRGILGNFREVLWIAGSARKCRGSPRDDRDDVRITFAG